MTSPGPVADASTYSDFAGLDALKRSARNNDPAAIREVAKQFESLFARMMIKSMRDAVGTDPIFGSDQEKMYQGMFDDQLSLELTKGKGLGLADMLIRQLQRMGAASAGNPDASATTADSSGATTASSAATTAASAPTTASSAATARSSSSTAPSAASSHSASRLPPASKAEQANFIRDLWPQAQQAGAQLGVDPRAVLAQAALETNWGRSVPRHAGGRSSNNLFGIKTGATWSGPSVAAGTQEFQNGITAPAAAEFRAYNSPTQSVKDYVALVSNNPRYAAARDTGSNIEAFASALQRGGYATDPNYAHKVAAIAGTISNRLASALAGTNTLKSASAVPIPSGTSTL